MNATAGLQESVPHAFQGDGRPAAPAGAVCAFCGAALRATKAGRARRNGRFCSPAHRAAETLRRRAAARAGLRAAVAELERLDQAREVAARISAALAVLGL